MERPSHDAHTLDHRSVWRTGTSNCAATKSRALADSYKIMGSVGAGYWGLESGSPIFLRSARKCESSCIASKGCMYGRPSRVADLSA